MTYYRVDKRGFAVGDTIATANEYFEKFSEAAKGIEEALERNRPALKPCRQECLFVFEDESSARKHWSKMTNGKLYEVTFDESEILHRGDMALMDIMKAASERGRGVDEIAVRYWAGACSAQPEIEILVPSGNIAKVLSSSERERVAFRQRRYFGDPGPWSGPLPTEDATD